MRLFDLNAEKIGVDVEATSKKPPLGIAFAPTPDYPFYLTFDKQAAQQILSSPAKMHTIADYIPSKTIII